MKGNCNPRTFATQEQRQHLYKLYFEKFWTLSEIGNLYSCTNVAVSLELKRNGWRARDRKAVQNKNINMYSARHIASYKELHTYFLIGLDDICKRYKISIKTLSPIAKQQGWFIPWGVLHSLRILEEKQNLDAECRYTFTEYARLSRTVTRVVVNNFLSHVKNYDMYKRFGYSVDHRISIYSAFFNTFELSQRLTMFELCHPCNLRIIRCAHNSSKRSKSSITPESLRRRIAIFNLEHGNPFHTDAFNHFGKHIHHYSDVHWDWDEPLAA